MQFFLILLEKNMVHNTLRAPNSQSPYLVILIRVEFIPIFLESFVCAIFFALYKKFEMNPHRAHIVKINS